MTEPTLEHIAEEARRGDEAAFRTLVGSTYRRIYRWALVRTGDRDDAEDVTQEVLIRMHRHLDSWEGRGSVLTWLYRITMNQSVSLERRTGPAGARRSEGPGEGGLPGPVAERGSRAGAGGVPAPEAGKAVERIDTERVLALIEHYLNDLPPAQRQAFQLVDVEGLRAVEAAELLAVSPSTVRVHLHRARATIRGRILDEHPELAEGRG